LCRIGGGQWKGQVRFLVRLISFEAFSIESANSGSGPISLIISENFFFGRVYFIITSDKLIFEDPFNLTSLSYAISETLIVLVPISVYMWKGSVHRGLKRLTTSWTLICHIRVTTSWTYLTSYIPDIISNRFNFFIHIITKFFYQESNIPVLCSIIDL